MLFLKSKNDHSSPDIRTGHPLLKSNFRLIEFLSEYIIKSVSFFSFAIIILIFTFVFRETLPVIFPSEKPALTKEEMVMETYGEEGAASAAGAEDQQAEKSPAETDTQDKATFKNLAGTSWQPVSNEPKYGLIPLVAGSLKVTIIAILLGAPIAILAALFTSTLAPKRMREIIKPSIELLAGFPSVVTGFFALITIASVLQQIFGYQYRLNALVGGAALALAVIPVIYTIADDALYTVPSHLTEAALALGASKWQSALFVTLPAATPGIFAAVLLGVGRAFGETMIVLMATGNASIMSFGISDPVRTMSATIGAEMAEVVFGDMHYGVLFLIGSILFIFTFLLNAAAEFWIRNKLIRRFRGA